MMEQPALMVEPASVAMERARRKQRQEAVECQEIISMLAACEGNITMAARKLGVSRNTVYRKIRQYSIQL